MALKLGCVVMAAGNAVRFGENKLSADYFGKPLIRCALDAVPAGLFARVAVVSQYPEILELAGQYGFLPVTNDAPQLGASRSIRLGMDAIDADRLDGVMFLVADQPRLRQASVRGAASYFKTHRAHIVALGYGSRRGNPVLFPRRFYDELRSLCGDRGGSAVIAANPERLLLYQAEDALELFDVDSPQALRELKQKVLSNRRR